jgi:hypothetical protein
MLMLLSSMLHRNHLSQSLPRQYTWARTRRSSRLHLCFAFNVDQRLPQANRSAGNAVMQWLLRKEWNRLNPQQFRR